MSKGLSGIDWCGVLPALALAVTYCLLSYCVMEAIVVDTGKQFISPPFSLDVWLVVGWLLPVGR